MDRIISIAVGTREAEEWFRTFEELSGVAATMGMTHHYVSVTSSAVDGGDTDSSDESEELYYDENTLTKVREAIRQSIEFDASAYGLKSVDTIVASLQNAGILFRERPRN